MDAPSAHDLQIVIGIVLCALALPALAGALADQRRPWAALVVLAAGLGLLTLAALQPPGLNDLSVVPHAFVRLVAWLRGLLI